MADKEDGLLGFRDLLLATDISPLNALTAVYVQSIHHAHVALNYRFCLLSYAEGTGNPYVKSSLRNNYVHRWTLRAFYAVADGNIQYPSPLFGEAQEAVRGYAQATLQLIDNDTTKLGGTISAFGSEPYRLRDNFTYWEWNGQALLGLLCEIPVVQLVSTS
jgi:hypothetical protein